MKTTVQIPANAKPGESIEIDIPGALSEADAMPKAVVEQIVKDRLTQFAKGHVKVDDLDEAAITALVEKKGFKLAGKSQDGDVGKQVEQAKKEWAERELKPVLEQVAANKTEVETLRRSQLTSEIVASAAKAGVLPAVLAGENPAILALVQQKSPFAFDEKTRRWYVQGPNGPAFSSNPTEQKPYKSPDEAVMEWVKDPANKPFVGMTTQQGPGLQSGGMGHAGAGFISSADARNPVKYRLAKEAAAKAGVELKLTD